MFIHLLKSEGVAHASDRSHEASFIHVSRENNKEQAFERHDTPCLLSFLLVNTLKCV